MKSRKGKIKEPTYGKGPDGVMNGLELNEEFAKRFMPLLAASEARVRRAVRKVARRRKVKK